MAPQALTVNLEGVMTWPLWISIVAAGQIAEVAMVMGEIEPLV